MSYLYNYIREMICPTPRKIKRSMRSMDIQNIDTWDVYTREVHDPTDTEVIIAHNEEGEKVIIVPKLDKYM
jgi:hypothetical protein